MSEGTAKRGLTPRQAAFVREYLLDLNATQAATRAGYSPQTADTQGPRLLENVGVREAIDAALDKRAAKLELKAEDVLRELQKIGFADPDAPEAPKAEEELDPGPFGGALERRRGASLRFEHKLKALELLGKHLKLFTDKVEHEHSFANMTDEQLRARYLALTATPLPNPVEGE